MKQLFHIAAILGLSPVAFIHRHVLCADNAGGGAAARGRGGGSIRNSGIGRFRAAAAARGIPRPF